MRERESGKLIDERQKKRDIYRPKKNKKKQSETFAQFLSTKSDNFLCKNSQSEKQEPP